MKNIKINNEQDLENAIRNTFPGEQYAKALEIVRRTASLVPTGKENIADAMNLIYFADTILNGNAIQQHFYLDIFSDFAKNSMVELFETMEANGFGSLILERTRLSEETRELQQEKNTLSKEISTLKVEKEELVAKKRQALEEVNILNSQKESLTKYIDELKKLLDEYHAQLPYLEEQYEVEWVPIDKDSEIYSLTPLTIGNYISHMIEEYQDKMHVTKEEAEREICLKCPNIYSLKVQMKKWNNDIIVAIQTNITAIKSTLSTFKVPVYRKKSSVEDMNVSSNFDAILKVLHYQKIAGEALAKRHVAEEQLKNVLQALKMIFPSESSINNIVEQIGFLSENPSDARPAQKLLN